jgi:hypothetical protein
VYHGNFCDDLYLYFVRQVLLPDGRLMTVSYYVDGESGFVPTITFEENYIADFEV